MYTLNITVLSKHIMKFHLYSYLDYNLQQFNNYYQHVDENVKPTIGLIGWFFGGVKDLFICSN